jgi:hypothetical protein
MSRNGSGTYTLPAGNPVVTGTTISSTWANSTLTDLATAMTGSLASDGQTTATGNLKMGNNRITGLADGIASTDAATVSQLTTAGATYLLKASNLSDVANATTARGNLTAAKSGANSDITSLTGLTTPLTVAQGGTGAATLTANNVLLGNGTSAPQVVAPSTAGNVLTSNGTTWVSSAPASAKVLQVISVTKTDTFTSGTTGAFTDITGMSATITPANAANKVLVTITGVCSGQALTSGSNLRLLRGSTTIGAGDSAGSRSPSNSTAYQADSSQSMSFSISFLDSPATTSATTYKLQFYVSSGTFYFNRTQSDSDAAGTGRYASTITVTEIAA